RAGGHKRGAAEGGSLKVAPPPPSRFFCPAPRRDTPGNCTAASDSDLIPSACSESQRGKLPNKEPAASVRGSWARPAGWAGRAGAGASRRSAGGAARGDAKAGRKPPWARERGPCCPQADLPGLGGKSVGCGWWAAGRPREPPLSASLGAAPVAASGAPDRVGGAAVLAVGIWTLVEKSGYLSVLASSTFAASAYILIFAGALVMVTGFLGFGAILREQKGCLSTYFCLLLVIFLVELVAGVLAHVYYQRLSDELKQHLNQTLAENYGQPGATQITASVDRLQQDFKCCGSNSSADWQHSTYILSREAEGRRVPDSCCKTVVTRCGQRAHPSNIYKVEGGCLTKLEQFLADHLLLMGAVGIGVACLQAESHGQYLPQRT
uniref:CD151 antigen n=1 Tax=Macaca fascicularis TaxID=9541 RepID=A0A7N9D800_MACFA